MVLLVAGHMRVMLAVLVDPVVQTGLRNMQAISEDGMRMMGMNMEMDRLGASTMARLLAEVAGVPGGMAGVLAGVAGV
jgi:hypothetical protein